MEHIRYIKLHNSGAFVARIKVLCTSMDDGHTYDFEQGGYHDICAAAERTLDLKDDPAGAIKADDLVKLKAIVVLGKDKEASQTFMFDPNSSKTARYTISGTTLINSLKFEGCD